METLEKVRRDTFSMLQSDWELLISIKKKCLAVGVETNKSELVRAGLYTLDKLPIDKLTKLLSGLPKMKIGRKKITS